MDALSSTLSTAASAVSDTVTQGAMHALVGGGDGAGGRSREFHREARDALRRWVRARVRRRDGGERARRGGGAANDDAERGDTERGERDERFADARAGGEGDEVRLVLRAERARARTRRRRVTTKARG